MSNYAERSFVYFVRCGDFVKIGFSYDPEKRMVALRSSVKRGEGVLPPTLDRSVGLELIHVIPGCRMRDERNIQGLFHMHHVLGEWFWYDVKFQRHLARLRYQTHHEREVQARRYRADARKAA